MENRISRYSLLLKSGNEYMVYNTRTNNYYHVEKSIYDFLEGTEKGTNKKSIPLSTIEQLYNLKILASEKDDDNYFESLKLKNLIASFSASNVSLTIAPTIQCNLRCPYCYEDSKPKKIIDLETCDKIIEFIQNHQRAKTLSLVWYGGEPLIAIDSIKYILNKIKENEEINLIYHGMVTNATLLNEKAIEVLKKRPLNNIQITLDGIKATHDTRRIRQDGSGTFEEIIDNLTKFADTFPETSIQIRVNIDKNNSSEFIQVKDFVKNLLPNKRNISVYPGILKGDCDCNAESSYLKSKDLILFYNTLYKNGTPLQIYPEKRPKGCCATTISGYVIGPKGELYNCWMDIGHPNKEIGNIKDKAYSNEESLNTYLLHGNCFDNEDCKKCKLLPICFGGCARERIENKYYNANHELCSMYKQDNWDELKLLPINYFHHYGYNFQNTKKL